MKEPKGDIHWYIPGKKKPFAYSTKATSNLIVALMDKQDTIYSLRQKITYDKEAQHILDLYIIKGYGNQIACQWFR